MTRVDFYILPEDTDGDPRLVACRITEKAYTQGHRVFIHTDSRGAAEAMDNLLWTYRQDSFLPHAICGTDLAENSPIQIGYDVEPEGDCDVLLNLAPQVPDFFSRFRRVAEVVAGDGETRERARESFRFYKDRGYPLESHKLQS